VNLCPLWQILIGGQLAWEVLVGIPTCTWHDSGTVQARGTLAVLEMIVLSLQTASGSSVGLRVQNCNMGTEGFPGCHRGPSHGKANEQYGVAPDSSACGRRQTCWASIARKMKSIPTLEGWRTERYKPERWTARDTWIQQIHQTLDPWHVVSFAFFLCDKRANSNCA